MGPPYRADQVGSLLRPPELLKARADLAEGKVDLEYLRYEEDRAILDVLALQRQVGMDVLTDGEYRRGGWMTDMAESVEGFVRQSMVMRWHGPNGGDEPSLSSVVGGKLKRRKRLTGDQAPFLVEHAQGPVKMTIPSPSGFMASSWRPGVSDAAYPTPAAMLHDLSAIVRDEVAALAGEGVAYIQLDTPQYSYFADQHMLGTLREKGLDLSTQLDLAIESDNACLNGLDRSKITTGLHICRGNSRSRWVAEGGYDAIAEQLFGGLEADRFLLEYDSDRAGGFEPLRFVPPPKVVVLGLVTTKSPELEDRDRLARRIEQASQFVPLERLALSPQCGFASVAAGNLLDWDDQRRKLQLVVDTARLVWGTH
ncbi:MAG: hypothetical protein JO247_02155 [Chloroflexi bacterium]|nr:hypothetical protein [Chloroflexota bacterium]